MIIRRKPSFAEEKRLRAEGYELIAGVDEVGRGALMGPVLAAAVILPRVVRARWRDKVRDSKQLTPADRDYLYGYIREAAVAVGVGSSSHEVIDEVGIARAARLAMVAAVGELLPRPHYLLIDYFKLREITLPQKGITGGDSLCFSIACASIIAKVTRDRLVVALDSEYPGYGFAAHKGYATPEHLACLRRKGPCPQHRRSFQPIKEYEELKRGEASLT